MYSVSRQYKQGINEKIRRHGYMSVSIGVVNQEAQAGSQIQGEFTRYSNVKLPLTNKEVAYEYATMEQDFVKADGTKTFLNEDTEQFVTERGIVTDDFCGSFEVKFDNVYEIKGLTFEFGSTYPTEFTIETDNEVLTYVGNGKEWSTTHYFGSITHFIVRANKMVGGQQRLRINRITIGVGINFTNEEIINATHTEFVNAVTEEIPSIDFSLSVTDYERRFNVDDDNSFTNFFETGQIVNYSVGLELADGSIEWIPMGKLRLNGWGSQGNQARFTASDRLSFMDETYSDGNTIHSRTLYDDAVAVLTSAGFEPDEYQLDECLRDVTIVNPLPEVSHAECLQLIANAGRCKLFQNRDGIICITANFSTVLDPDDFTPSSDTQAPWSNIGNIMKGSEFVYADMSKNMHIVNGSMFFLPEDGERYLDTSFVSSEVSDKHGEFGNNPTLSIGLPAGFTFYSIYFKFDSQAPKEVVVTTFHDGVQQDRAVFTDLEKEGWVSYEFKVFDRMMIEVTKGYPNSRVAINKVMFGELTDYTIKQDDMLQYPTGVREKKAKSVSVKRFSFVNDSEGRPQQVDDYVFATHVINPTGISITFENPLISSQEHAEQIAEWLGQYYKNNVTYDVKYRGEPRLNASDIVYMESDVLNNLQVEIETATFTFNGAFGGTLNLRRAFKNNGGTE